MDPGRETGDRAHATGPRPDGGLAAHSELWFSRRPDALWSLLREDGRDVELRVEVPGRAPAVGQIYKARVADLVPGLGAAFVDLGTGRNAFLPLGGAPVVATAGADLLIQVEREPLREKAARLSLSPSLPGRHIVLLPAEPRRAVSRRVRDEAERERLADLLAALPGHEGYIARTAAIGADAALLETEAAALRAEWQSIAGRLAMARGPTRVHDDLDLLLRQLRDAPPRGIDEVIVDDPTDRERASAWLAEHDPTATTRVRQEHETGAAFRRVRAVIDEAMRPRIWLPHGGFLAIEPTEALVSIDVNTGKHTGRRGAPDAALETNLEAAREIGRRLRLVDLGGLVVIDFVQLDDPGGRRRVLDALGEALRPDPARVRVGKFSDFGLVELSRERSRPGLVEHWTRPCGQCAGRGRVARSRDATL